MNDRQVLFFPLQDVPEDWLEPLSENEKVLFDRSRDKTETTEWMLKCLAQYRLYNNAFIKDGLTYDVFRKIRIVSLLETFDILHLYQYCSLLPKDGVYLEIGSNTGGSLMCAYEASKHRNIKYIGIDPFRCEAFVKPAFYKNTEYINCEFYEKPSSGVVDIFKNNSVDLLLIDGDHTYDGAKQDIVNYFPKLKIGGRMFIHDVVHPIFTGVANAVVETIKNHEFIKMEKSTFVMVEKTSEML